LDIRAEIVHLIRHIVKEEIAALRNAHWGHISGYNPKGHTVKVLIPSLRDQNGNMYETSDLPLGTMRTGPGWGLQYAPALANATPDNLIGGEQVQVSLHDRRTGVGEITKFAFNVTHTPPGAGASDGSTNSDDDTTGTNQLQPGEMIDKFQSGTFFKIFADGHMALFTKDKLVINTSKECDLNVLENDLTINILTGNATVTLNQGSATVEAKLGNITALTDEGHIFATAKVGNIYADAILGNITISAPAGTVDVVAGLACTVTAQSVQINTTSTIALTAGGIVSISAPGIDLTSAIIDAGSGAIQQLLNAAYLLWGNNHVHVSSSPGSLTSAPVAPAVLGIQSTNNLEGS
jgi:hypothetical protein